MTRNDRIETLLQRLGTETSFQTQRARDVVRPGGWRDLIDRPEAFLRKSHWELAVSFDPHYRYFCHGPVDRAQALNRCRQLTDSRVLKHRTQRQDYCK